MAASRTPTAEQSLASLEALIAGGRASEAVRPLRMFGKDARGQVLLAEALYLCGDPAGARTAADAAHTAALREGDEEELATTTATLVLALAAQRSAAAMQRARELIDGLPQRPDESPLTAHARATMLLHGGEIDAARLAWLAAVTGREDRTLDRHAAAAHQGLAGMHSRTGDPTRALYHLEMNLEIRLRLGDRAGEGLAHVRIGEVLTRAERPRRALAEQDDALECFRETHDAPGQARARRGRGRALLELEKLDDAEQELIEARRFAEGRGLDFEAAACHRDLAIVAEWRGGLEGTTRRVRRAAKRLRMVGDEAGIGFCHLVQGRAFEAAGRPREASSQFARAVKLLRDVGRPDLLAESLVRLADVSGAEHPNGAARWLAEAEDLARSHYIPYVLSEVRDVRDDMGEHLPGHSIALAGNAGENRRYLLLERLAGDAQGDVWRALDETTARHVIVERIHLPPDADDLDRAVRRAESELAGALAVDDPAVARLFACTRQGDTFHLCTELIQGEDLGQRLDGGSIEPERAWRWIGAIGLGLDALHRGGVIHRDVRPGNVRLLDGERPVLINFGAPLRGLVGGSEDSGSLRGYLAPEQIRGWVVDFRADLFSYGMLAVELLTGAHFILDLSDIRTARSYRQTLLDEDAFRALLAGVQWPPHVKAQQAEALCKLLEYTARHRPQSAADFLDEALG